jgi:hypothetical protein
VRITARYSEANTHMYLYHVPRYELAKLLETKQFSVRVSLMRKPTPKQMDIYDTRETVGFHKVTLSQQVAKGRLDVVMASHRLTEKDILELKLLPIPKAVEKERHHAITAKLKKAT